MTEAVICSLVLFVWFVNQRLRMLEELVDEHWRARRENYKKKEDE